MPTQTPKRRRGQPKRGTRKLTGRKNRGLTQRFVGGPPALAEATARVRQIEALADRRRRAWELKYAGATYEQIGERLGVSGKTAFEDIAAYRAALERAGLLDANALRAAQQAGIDRLKRTHFARLAGKDADRATAAILGAMEREARLNGLDARPKDGVVTLDQVRGMLVGFVTLFHELVADQVLRRRFAEGMRRLGPAIEARPEPER